MTLKCLTIYPNSGQLLKQALAFPEINPVHHKVSSIHFGWDFTGMLSTVILLSNSKPCHLWKELLLR